MRYLAVVLVWLAGYSLPAQAPDPGVLLLKAPQHFKARFKTTKGDFIIEAYRKWSPLGVDRLYQLIKTGFYDNSVLFRVQHNYVIQFGISNERPVNRFWDAKKLPDEPARYHNLKSVIAYAREGVNSRTTQLFINTVDNPKLDTAVRNGLKGYTPIARVIKGMDIVARFCDTYGRSTLAYQDSVYRYGNQYLYQHFPGLDKIISAVILD